MRKAQSGFAKALTMMIKMGPFLILLRKSLESRIMLL